MSTLGERQCRCKVSLHPTLACEATAACGNSRRRDRCRVARVMVAGRMVFRRRASSGLARRRPFGTMERTVRSDWASPVVPEISIISNLKDRFGRPIGGLGEGIAVAFRPVLHAAPGNRRFALRARIAAAGSGRPDLGRSAAYADRASSGPGHRAARHLTTRSGSRVQHHGQAI